MIEKKKNVKSANERETNVSGRRHENAFLSYNFLRILDCYLFASRVTHPFGSKREKHHYYFGFKTLRIIFCRFLTRLTLGAFQAILPPHFLSLGLQVVASLALLLIITATGGSTTPKGG